MARIYTVQFDNALMTAATQSLFTIYNSATIFNKAMRVLRVVISANDATIPTSQMMGIQVKLLTGTLTLGTGGAAATPQKVDQGDPTATFLARVNDLTTVASGTTTNIVYDGGFHVYNGFDESFFSDGSNPRGALPVFIGTAASGSAGSAGISVQVAAGITGTVHLNGTAWVEEIG
jgi:hypothetical protein